MQDQSVTESVEAECMYDYLRHAPEELGPAVARIGGGVAVSARRDPSRFWSKALGFTEPITGELIDDVLDFYRKQNNPYAVVQIAPAALPDGWAEICSARGIRAGSEWVKVAAEIDAIVPAAPGPLEVAPIAHDDAAPWADAMLKAFGVQVPGLSGMFAAVATRERYQPYAVWSEGRIVACANLFINGDVALLNGAATLPEFRGRGAQTALIQARIEAARAAGCRLVVSETGKPAPEQSNSSLNNLVQGGLRIRYARRNWIWSGAP